MVVALIGLALLGALVPAHATAAQPEPGARFADTDFAYWVNLRVAPGGGRFIPRGSRVEDLTGCPGLDFHVGTRGRPVRISRSGRFEWVRRRGRFVLTVTGRFVTSERARISFRHRRVPRRRGRECDDSGRVTLTPERVAPLRVSNCRTHEAPDLLLTAQGRVFSHRTWLGRDGWGSVVHACLFSVNKPFELGQDEDDDNDLDRFRLVEPYVAYEHSECGMGCFYSLHVQDLRDGAVRHLPREPQGTFGQVTDMVLRESGSVAWIARPAQYFGLREPAVWADDGQVSRLLDSGNIELESLELNGSTLTWVKDGASQSATLD
jgi:hypothetical protein